MQGFCLKIQVFRRPDKGFLRPVLFSFRHVFYKAYNRREKNINNVVKLYIYSFYFETNEMGLDDDDWGISTKSKEVINDFNVLVEKIRAKYRETYNLYLIVDS